MKHASATVLALLLCAAPALAADPPSDAPPKPGWSSSAKDCNWVWREGGGVGLWTEVCDFGNGLRAVAYDAARDLFTTTVDGKPDMTVLRQFREPGGPEALAAALKKQGLLLDSAECQMVKVPDTAAPAGWTGWNVMPTGKLKEAFDKEVQEQVPEPPCGELGYTADSVTFFMVKDDAPGRVFHVDLGQDASMLDIKTIRLQ